MPALQTGRALIAGLVVAILGIGGAVVNTLTSNTHIDMRIESSAKELIVGKTFTVTVVVESDEPVNVFQGNLHFDPTALTVESIDYNTSIADLWAEKPWYENGAGTLNFIGGTTVPGGFIGIGNLLTITFRTIKGGATSVGFDEVRILKHDGLGTDADIMKPIDKLFTVSDTELQQKTVLKKIDSETDVAVLPDIPSTDLNDDGDVTIADISIFMQHLFTQNLRSDFSGDGKVTATDLSIIMNAL